MRVLKTININVKAKPASYKFPMVRYAHYVFTRVIYAQCGFPEVKYAHISILVTFKKVSQGQKHPLIILVTIMLIPRSNTPNMYFPNYNKYVSMLRYSKYVFPRSNTPYAYFTTIKIIPNVRYAQYLFPIVRYVHYVFCRVKYAQYGFLKVICAHIRILVTTKFIPKVRNTHYLF